MDFIKKTKEEWLKQLTQEQYRVLFEKGTEPAFSGQYCNHHEAGFYQCAACGKKLFDASSKFDSGTGWPSFWKPAEKNAVKEEEDFSYGMIRMEVLCSSCGGHLGHVFDDGPRPTGKRYCVNSASLKFEKNK